MNHCITDIRILTEDTFVLRFSRQDLEFKAGQRIIVGLKNDLDQRDYSIYSGEKDDYLEILVKEIDEGNVSVKLRNCKQGEELNVDGPYGTFILREEDRSSARLIFIATGTGISPFHSFVRSYNNIDYILIHGIRYREDAYDRDQYDQDRYKLCVSGETIGTKQRVTDYVRELKITRDMYFFLCGNGSMIYDVSKILINKEVRDDRILREIYFA